jgi:hypothetical protein
MKPVSLLNQNEKECSIVNELFMRQRTHYLANKRKRSPLHAGTIAAQGK